MPFDFDTVIERRGTASAKYDYIVINDRVDTCVDEILKIISE